MSVTFRLDRTRALLFDAAGQRLDLVTRTWVSTHTDATDGESLGAIEAAAWVQRETRHRLRVPIGVVGPRDATQPQLAAALTVGELLADCGFGVVCGDWGMWDQQAGTTVFSPFPGDTDYFPAERQLLPRTWIVDGG